MDKQRALLIIDEYMLDHQQVNAGHEFKSAFEWQSYRKWAADEIKNQILLRRTVDPTRVVEEFNVRMYSFHKLRNKKIMPFAAAYEVSSEILTIMYAVDDK